MLLETELKDQSKRKDAITQDLLAERVHRRKMEQISLESQGTIEKETLKEDRKDARIDQQSTNQSKLIEQRKNDTGTVEFPNNEIVNTEFIDELDKVFDETKLLPNQEV